MPPQDMVTKKLNDRLNDSSSSSPSGPAAPAHTAVEIEPEKSVMEVDHDDEPPAAAHLAGTPERSRRSDEHVGTPNSTSTVER